MDEVWLLAEPAPGGEPPQGVPHEQQPQCTRCGILGIWIALMGWIACAAFLVAMLFDTRAVAEELGLNMFDEAFLIGVCLFAVTLPPCLLHWLYCPIRCRADAEAD